MKFVPRMKSSNSKKLKGKFSKKQRIFGLRYKDESPQPVYSFDARFSTVKHWSEDPDFGPRAYFRYGNSRGFLDHGSPNHVFSDHVI